MKGVRTLALMVPLAALALALSGACGDDDGGAGPTGTLSPADEGDGSFEIALVAEGVQFDQESLTAPAGAEVSLTLDNRDTVQHSFSLFETAESTEPLFDGEEFDGPSFLTYQFTAPEAPGTYHFHCDVHLQAMEGDFVVE